MQVLLTNNTKNKKQNTFIKNCLKALLKELDLEKTEVSILLTDNNEIKDLNNEYRNIDKATDVLSFPMEDDVLLGDIVISLEKAKEQAPIFNNSYKEEILRLLIHGLLHLIGYDHINGGRQAKKMTDKEKELLSFTVSIGLLN